MVSHLVLWRERGSPVMELRRERKWVEEWRLVGSSRNFRFMLVEEIMETCIPNNVKIHLGDPFIMLFPIMWIWFTGESNVMLFALDVLWSSSNVEKMWSNCTTKPILESFRREPFDTLAYIRQIKAVLEVFSVRIWTFGWAWTPLFKNIAASFILLVQIEKDVFDSTFNFIELTAKQKITGDYSQKNYAY